MGAKPAYLPIPKLVWISAKGIFLQ